MYTQKQLLILYEDDDKYKFFVLIGALKSRENEGVHFISRILVMKLCPHECSIDLQPPLISLFARHFCCQWESKVPNVNQR